MSILEVTNLKKDSFIEEVSFSIDEKGVYAFLGKESSGKSALAEILAGASETDGGKVIFRDVDIYTNTRQSKSAKAKIGYVPENIFFYPDMTAFEVLDFTGRLKKVDPDKRFRQIKEAFELLAISEKMEEFPHCRLCGLMTIPPVSKNKGENCRFFEKIRRLSVDIMAKKQHNSSMEILSMGMTDDFEDAIACGSTMIRVGTAIFGARNYTK